MRRLVGPSVTRAPSRASLTRSPNIVTCRYTYRTLCIRRLSGRRVCCITIRATTTCCRCPSGTIRRTGTLRTGLTANYRACRCLQRCRYCRSRRPCRRTRLRLGQYTGTAITAYRTPCLRFLTRRICRCSRRGYCPPTIRCRTRRTSTG